MPTEPSNADSTELLPLAESVCLALVAESPRHGWALVKELAPSGEIGRIWSLSRALTYRAVDRLLARGLVERGPAEAGRGPSRVVLHATDAGRAAADAWLGEPVRHIRDLRTEFLVKATLLRRSGGDLLALLDAQEAALVPQLESLGSDRSDPSPVGLWRRESARAAQRFFGELRAELSSGPEAVRASSSTRSSSGRSSSSSGRGTRRR